MEEISKIIEVSKHVPSWVLVLIILYYYRKKISKVITFFEWYEKQSSEASEQQSVYMNAIIGQVNGLNTKFEAFTLEESKKNEVFVSQLIELKVDQEATKKNIDILTPIVHETKKKVDKIHNHLNLPNE